MNDDLIEILDHTADLAMRIHAENKSDLFKLSARAVYQAVGKPIAQDIPGEKYTLELRAGNQEDLLHDWLAEILYYVQVRHILFDRFEFEAINDTYLKTVAEGRPLDLTRSEFEVEIKAVTYHHLKIEQTDQGLIATFIFDI